jgi:hypothetical protein
MDVLTSLRQYKVGAFTIFDTVISYIGVFLLAPLLTRLFLKLHVSIPLFSWLWLTLPVSILFHLAFHQMTPLTTRIMDPNGFYREKIVLLGMVIMGIRSIRLI